MTTAAPAPPVAGDLRIPGEPGELWRARRFAEEAAAEFGFDDEESFAFAFAVNEAVSNAVEHGKPCDGGTVRLRIEEDGPALTFWVKDCGCFEPKVRPLDAIEDRGRGMAFMAAMVDELHVTPVQDGTVVSLTKRRTA
jgi:anti-sigma regulatory factor (Ser/Thr protein kinase)